MSNATSPIQNLTGNEASKKLKDIAENVGTCFFTTKVGEHANSRPMAIQKVESDGSLWFISAVDSHKNKEILEDEKVHLYFMNNSRYEYVFIKGNATISQDKALIEKYWSAFANAWFDGKDDPRVSVIKIVPYDGYYYETKDNKIFALLKMSFNAITGVKTEDGGVEGSLKV